MQQVSPTTHSIGENGEAEEPCSFGKAQALYQFESRNERGRKVRKVQPETVALFL